MSNLSKRVLEEFTKIVAIDSLSFNEQAMFDYLEKRLREFPVEKEFLPYTEENTGHTSGNLIVHIPANRNGGKKIFFDAHLDTVEPGTGIRAIVKNGRVESAGETVLGADDKAGVAAMIISIEEICNSGLQHDDVYFLFTSAEEVGLEGIKHLDVSKIDVDFGYVLDSHGPVGGIVTAAPFHYVYDIQVKGKASHAGIAPEYGVNAIKIAAQIIAELPQGKLNHDSVANVGIIEGGRATNIVADHCHIRGEYRSIKKSDCDNLEKLVTKVVKTKSASALSTNLKIIPAYKGFRYNDDEPIVKTVDNALKEIGIEPHHEETRGGSHSNIYGQLGIKALTLSIGMEEIHSTKEYIRVEDLENTTRLILKLTELAGKETS